MKGKTISLKTLAIASRIRPRPSKKRLPSTDDFMRAVEFAACDVAIVEIGLNFKFNSFGWVDKMEVGIEGPKTLS